MNMFAIYIITVASCIVLVNVVELWRIGHLTWKDIFINSLVSLAPAVNILVATFCTLVLIRERMSFEWMDKIAVGKRR